MTFYFFFILPISIQIPLLISLFTDSLVQLNIPNKEILTFEVFYNRIKVFVNTNDTLQKLLSLQKIIFQNIPIYLLSTYPYPHTIFKLLHSHQLSLTQIIQNISSTIPVLHIDYSLIIHDWKDGHTIIHTTPDFNASNLPTSIQILSQSYHTKFIKTVIPTESIPTSFPSTSSSPTASSLPKHPLEEKDVDNIPSKKFHSNDE